jgi:hypothetical protein
MTTVPRPPARPLVRSVRIVADPGSRLKSIFALLARLGLRAAFTDTDKQGRQVITWDRW